MDINVISHNKVYVIKDIKINVVSNNKVNVINDIKMLPINIEMSLQGWKKLAGKKKKVEQYYKDWYDKIKNYKFKRAASADFYRRATEPITGKIEEQTKKIEEQTEKQLALVPNLIKFDEPPKVSMLLDTPLPGEEESGLKEITGDIDTGLEKKCLTI